MAAMRLARRRDVDDTNSTMAIMLGCIGYKYLAPGSATTVLQLVKPKD
jgi:hypothetical protein